LARKDAKAQRRGVNKSKEKEIGSRLMSDVGWLGMSRPTTWLSPSSHKLKQSNLAIRGKLLRSAPPLFFSSRLCGFAVFARHSLRFRPFSKQAAPRRKFRHARLAIKSCRTRREESSALLCGSGVKVSCSKPPFSIFRANGGIVS
jgi:hypothetical protein